MTYDKDTNIYTADEGRLFVRKSDGRIFGAHVQLGRNGSIDDYEERTFTEKEIAALKPVGHRVAPRKPMTRREVRHGA